ncbi:MAG: branched-chain amino acid ABC transporter permease [Microbacterium sp.]|uniref:branched-chain amino acid ABC transporter permease n=1 Tax=Microbacterium sp. TaxID=51671 RepID=UPI00260FAB76|nr:branched-chain amino acid ABC transporter permease [Microbacterium sp.]MCX6501488.1 branched-chain amino acid ABC transporter permease [Microbacterium sp.]
MNRSALTAFVRHNSLGVVVAVIALAVVPLVAGAYWTRVLTVCAIYAIAAAGVAVLYGRVGLVSIMQVGLVAIGGWATLRIWHATHLPFEIVMILAAIVTGVIGTIVSLPALRLSGLSLAIVTLMVAGAIEVLISASGFPNGGPGFLGRVEGGTLPVAMPRPALAPDDPAYFRYVVVVLLVAFLLLSWLLASKPGRSWAAIRQGEAGAISVGVGVTRYRLLALAVVSALTGIAGALLAANAGLLDPVSFKAQQSILLFATVLIGGTFTLGGAVIAGFFFQGVPPLLDAWGVNGNLIFVILGLGLVQTITTAPGGIAGQLSALWTRVRARKKADR